MKLDSLAIRYDSGKLFVLDQQRLPQHELWLPCHSVDDMCEMIKTLQVRGAPLIGIAAILSLMQYVEQGATIAEVRYSIKKLIATRPTAVNLKNYMDTILKQLAEDPQIVLTVGEQLFLEDVNLCDNIAQQGLALIPERARIMTYCNTGGLATAGIGTALGVIKKAYEQGRIKHIYPCETRPLLQGGRLTAWELEKANIPYTLLCDNMAATLMQQHKIDAILVGADRIAMNGDVANKIGTYNLAVLAHHHHIPFYVVAPYTTIDKACPTGKDIVIEERSMSEVKGALGKITWAPQSAHAYNPAFDVTPAELITNYILDMGIFSKADFALSWDEKISATTVI